MPAATLLSRFLPIRARSLLLVVSALAFSGGSLPPQRAVEDRPNVIVILTDDQGTLDLNLYGAEDLRTPHMDALAASGTRFTQFYAGAPVCSPSRASVLTGRYPVNAGVPGNVSSERGQAGMPTEQVTLAEVFRQAGYTTAHVGKWHLGYTPETMPNGQGFDHSFGHMGGCIDNYSHFFYWNGPNRHDLHRNGVEIHEDGAFFPELMLREAGVFMAQHRDRPFLLYFAINTPHYPLQGYDHWLAYYEDLPYPRNLYAAFVSTQDEIIGSLIDQVEALGLRDRTIIVFQSDQGHSVEERTHGGGGFAGPYRGAKFSLFEAGIRVPAAVSWPGHIPAGAVRDQLAHGTDWLPTLADFAGVEAGDLDLDGRSLRNVIESDGPSPHDVLHWQVGMGEQAQWAVRRGPWKLIGNPNDPTSTQPVEAVNGRWLSNLEIDRSEQTNLLAAYPDVARELGVLRQAWLDRP